MSETPGRAETLQALVRGMVQGVGFRYFVLWHGRRLGLGGMVRNLPDGRVEVRARGSREDLETLAELLRQGPRMSRVEEVQLNWDVPCPETERFEIGF